MKATFLSLFAGMRFLRQSDAFFEPASARVARFDNEDERAAKFAVFYLLGGEDRELIRLLGQ